MPEPQIRCGDHVRHDPSGETWVVAFADYETGEIAWCGWPEGLARIADCRLTKAVTDEGHVKLAREIAAEASSNRANGVKRLYPEVFQPAHGVSPMTSMNKFADADAEFWRDNGVGGGVSDA